MAKFERAVLTALLTMHEDCWQREDVLMCESVILETHPQWFPKLRLWLLERRGKIESRKGAYFFGNLKWYRLNPAAREEIYLSAARALLADEECAS